MRRLDNERVPRERVPDIPELEDVYAPTLMPGDPVPEPNDHARNPVPYYTPDGDLMMGTLDSILRAVEMFRQSPDSLRQSSTFYRAGVKIRVSTVYLGLDHNPFGGVPLFWETMVFVGPGFQDMAMWRYGSRRAAMHGHAEVVTTIRKSQQRRSYIMETTAPRSRAWSC